MNGRELVKFLDVELKRRGIPKGEFYAAIGITATAYYGWRNGAVPKAETVEAIEKYLGVDLSSVDKEDEPDELREMLRSRQDLRRSELLHLNAEDIDTEKNIIHVRGASVIGEGNKLVDKETNKNSTSARDVHIVISRLNDLVKDKSGKLVTTNPTTLYGAINGLCKKAGLPEVGVHGLRHSYISMCFHLGWDMKTVMREGGYSNLQTVNDVYRHLAAQDANADIAQMIDFYAQKH